MSPIIAVVLKPSLFIAFCKPWRASLGVNIRLPTPAVGTEPFGSAAFAGIDAMVHSNTIAMPIGRNRTHLDLNTAGSPLKRYNLLNSQHGTSTIARAQAFSPIA